MVWFFFGLLAGLLLLSVLFILAPWFKQRALHSSWLPLGLSSVLVIFVSTWYFIAGKSQHVIYAQEDLSLRQISQLLESEAPLSSTVQMQIETELMHQEQRAGAMPSVGLLQAQLAMKQQNYTKAQHIYAQIYALSPDDPEIAVSYAQTWYLAENQQVSPELAHFLQVLTQRYATQISEQTGLINLLAVVAFNAGDYTKAIHYWQELLLQYPVGSPEEQAIQSGIAQAKIMHVTNEKELGAGSNE